MKKKALKTVALIVAIVLVAGICVVANALVGNPVSKILAQKAAASYLAENHPDTDYYIESVGYDFKFTEYHAHVCSESSMDTRFTLDIDMFGHVIYDTYENVANGFVTANRVEQEYRELADQVFESPAFPYPDNILYGTLEIYPREAEDAPDYAIVQEDLILDHIYDPRDLGAQAGHLVVYVDSETITYDLAAEILLEIRGQFDDADIPFYAIDFVLEAPLPEEGPRPEDDIRIENFRYDEITENELAERIADAHEACMAYYASMDDK